ncbi:MAG: hypothetical protein ACK47B_08540 [Armatimonadota bacterium]
MNTYVTALRLITEIHSPSPGQGLARVESARERLLEHLELATENTRLTIRGVRVEMTPEEIEGARGQVKRFHFTVLVVVEIGVNASEKAAEEVKAALGRIHDYAQAAFAETEVKLKEVLMGKVHLSKPYHPC